MKDPIGYELPFVKVFTKYTIPLCDLFIEILKDKNIRLFCKDARKYVDNFEILKELNDFGELIEIKIEGAKWEEA